MRVIAYGSETAAWFLEKFGALVVDWFVGFENEGNGGLLVVESCVHGFLSAGRPSATLPTHVAERCR